MYDETGAASARFLRWLADETGGIAGSRVPSAAYAPHERCSLELVEGVVERLAALGWIAVHNDSGAIPPLVSPTDPGLAEVRAWDEAYDDREARRRYAKAALFAWADRTEQQQSGEPNAEDFLWAREAFYCGRQLALEDLEYAKDHLNLPTPLHISVAQDGAGLVLSFEQVARLVQASRPDLPEGDDEVRRVRDLAAALTDASRNGAGPDESALRQFLQRSGELAQAGSRASRDMGTGVVTDIISSMLGLG